MFMNIDKICLMDLPLISTVYYSLLKAEGDILKTLKLIHVIFQLSGIEQNFAYVLILTRSR